MVCLQTYRNSFIKEIYNGIRSEGIINKAWLKWCQNAFQGHIQKKILLWDNELKQANTRKFKIFTKLYPRACALALSLCLRIV